MVPKDFMNFLRSEIEFLEQTVSKEREKYQLSTQAMSAGLSAIPVMIVNDSVILPPTAVQVLIIPAFQISLSADDATYILSLELPSPIENVLVQSDVALEMLDVEGNTAVVSKSECDKNDGNLLLCCYRCQANTNRVDLRFRTIEGQQGILRVYITPNIQPKCCQMKTYTIHPLSLHMAVHNYDETM